MQRKKLFNSCCVLLMLICVFIVAPTQAGIDFLDAPAQETSRASKSLLLDVVKAGDRLVAVGERGHIVYSHDGGDDWLQAEVPVYVTLTAVHFPTPLKGWSVGHDGVVLSSTDGGKTWAKQLDGYFINEQVLAQAQARYEAAEAMLDSASDDEELEEAEFQLDEASFALDNAKEDLETGPAKPLLDVWFRNEYEGFVVGSYGIFLYTADGGKSWQLVSERLNNPYGLHLNAIDSYDGEAIYIAGEAGSLHRSTDGGKSWELLPTPYDGSYFGLIVSKIGNGVEKILTFGLRGNLYASDDAGETWHRAETQTQASFFGGTTTEDGRLFVVGGDGKVLSSVDGGHKFSSATRKDRLPNSAIVEFDKNELVLVGYGGVRYMKIE